MRELSLFTGAGGGLLGTALLGFTPVGAVEINPYCREVLLRRQRDGVLPLFPIWDDCRTFDGRPWRGKVDIVTGGFPCQPFSSAGKRLAEDDPRNGWPWCARILGEVRPRYALLENVRALLTHDYFGTILGDLAALGYDVEWDCIPASAVGAPHRRDRLWILAYAQHGSDFERCDTTEKRRWPHAPEQARMGGESAPAGDVADADGERCDTGRGTLGDPGARPDERDARRGAQRLAATRGETLADAECGDAQAGREPTQRSVESGLDGSTPRLAPWLVELGTLPARWADGSWEAGLPRVTQGTPHRVQRLTAIGNGQVPHCVVAAWHLLTARAGIQWP